MSDSEPKALPGAPGQHLLDRPGEEKLLQEIESLRRELEEARNHKKKEDSSQHAPKRPARRMLVLLALGLAVLLILGFFIGFLPRYRRERELRKAAQAESQELPVVTFIQTKRSPANAELMLPGNIQALTDAPILARADGYLRRRYVDMGDHVKAGQLLAEIEAPDLDQQVRQARAQLLQAEAASKQATASLEQGRANESLALVTANRWAGLLNKGAVSRQDNDTQQTNARAQTANVGALQEAISAAQENVSAARANLDRLLQLQSYEQVRAPFTGIVTLRNIDTGALISNGSTLLFRVVQIDRLRTYIYVPEMNAPSVQVGQPATLQMLEFPDRQFTGSITRTSSSLDPSSRTLLTEVQVPNPTGILLPGMFAQVNLNNNRQKPPVLIPGDALMVESNGTFVAVLTGEQKPPPRKKQQSDSQDSQRDLSTFTIHLVPVKVGRDYGNQIEIISGLNGGERIVASPNDDVRENAKVKGQLSTHNPDQPAQPAGGKQNSNTEQLSPQKGAEPAPKQPDKENKTRGPGN